MNWTQPRVSLSLPSHLISFKDGNSMEQACISWCTFYKDPEKYWNKSSFIVNKPDGWWFWNSLSIRQDLAQTKADINPPIL